MFRQTAALALALLPFSLGQLSEDFESGWDETAWPIYGMYKNILPLNPWRPFLETSLGFLFYVLSLPCARDF